MVRMKNKVVQFPKPPRHAEFPIDEPMVIFSLGNRRFLVQHTVTELRRQPAEVILLQKRSRRKRTDAHRPE
jgi:hypothetical protein